MFKKIMMFAASIASRGFNNNVVDVPTKQLRVLSCYGDNIQVGQCPYLKKSSHSEYFYCSGCGCGDKKQTWLLQGAGEYAKLDYPVLNCPMKMPGFTNYDPNFYNDTIKAHKTMVEDYDPEKLQYIQVTINRNQENEKIFDEYNKLFKNS
tara:strand:- start:32 stop:481 length:450 start_codon:yes stop_codon:yes gene_type:complete